MKIKISLRIIAVFMTAILVSFIPEYYPDFFGDWTCHANEFKTCSYASMGGIPHEVPRLHWGYRHYLFFIMGLVLFCIQVFDIINSD